MALSSPDAATVSTSAIGARLRELDVFSSVVAALRLLELLPGTPPAPASAARPPRPATSRASAPGRFLPSSLRCELGSRASRAPSLLSPSLSASACFCAAASSPPSSVRAARSRASASAAFFSCCCAFSTCFACSFVGASRACAPAPRASVAARAARRRRHLPGHHRCGRWRIGVNFQASHGEFGADVFAGATGAGVDGALGAGFIAGPFGSGVDFDVTGFDGTDALLRGRRLCRLGRPGSSSRSRALARAPSACPRAASPDSAANPCRRRGSAQSCLDAPCTARPATADPRTRPSDRASRSSA